MNRLNNQILLLLLGLVLALLITNSWLGYENIRQMRASSLGASRSRDIIVALENIAALASDAESGQRGYLLTGEPHYLDPYKSAVARIDTEVKALEGATAGNPAQSARIPELKKRIAAKLLELQETIALRGDAGFAAAREMVVTERGKIAMENLRTQVAAMIAAENATRAASVKNATENYWVALTTELIGNAIAIGFLGALIFALRRALRARRRHETEIEAQRELFRTTIASIGDAVLTTDVGGRVTSLNAIAQALTGWSEKDATGRPVQEIFTIVNAETGAPAQSSVERVLREGAIVGLANHTLLIGKNGVKKPIDVSAAPIRGSSGKLLGVVMVFRDVSERRKAEQALRESEEKFRRQSAELEQQLIASGRLVSLGEITASMAHEFNNPLGVILGFAQELRSEADAQSPDHQALKIIEEETERCKKIIEELLQFTRPVGPQPRSIAIRPIVETSLRFMSHQLHKQKIELSERYADDLPQTYLDPRQLEQVLVNLYLNAIAAMPHGGKLAVGVQLNPPSQAPGIVITVQDDGFGIDRESLPKIFQPFFTAKKRTGLGLGLTVCERIVKNHGGRIEVESEPGEGTIFTIVLPVRDGAPGENAEGEDRTPRSHTTEARPGAEEDKP